MKLKEVEKVEITVIMDNYASIGCKTFPFKSWENRGVDIMVREGIHKTRAEELQKILMLIIEQHIKDLNSL